MVTNPHNRKLTPQRGLLDLCSKLHIVADRQTGLYLQAVHSCSAKNGKLPHEILDNQATAAHLPWLVVTGNLDIISSHRGRVAFYLSQTTSASAGYQQRLVPQFHRPLYPGSTRRGGIEAITSRRSPDTLAARYLGPYRAASNPPGPAPVPGKPVS